MPKHTFGSRGSLRVGDLEYGIYRLEALAREHAGVANLPFSLKILLENLLRTEDGVAVRAEDVVRLASWQPTATPADEIAFTPSRVLLQDFTGVPAVVDLAAMREAMQRMGGDPARINPLQPVELVIDHSVQVDHAGSPGSFQRNADIELERNLERYRFLRWGNAAFQNFSVVPPDTGIVHQVNLEYLARVVMTDRTENPTAYPDTVVGNDSHTTMINALGVLGWGVGGIEAEAAMLGQPVSMLIPQVVGMKLTGVLRAGATATDLVLTITQMLRRKGVVGKFVEFFGNGLASLGLADRATVANMAPEYGATCGIFPIDAETLRYLRFTGRREAHVQLVEAYAREQGLFHTAETPEASYSDRLELDLDTVEPSLAGPTRPQDRVRLSDAQKSFRDALAVMMARAEPKPHHQDVGRLQAEGGAQTAVGAQSSTTGSQPPLSTSRRILIDEAAHDLDHGAVVIAAITSCTNTSNPSVLVAAGLLAKKAVERGLRSKPWVKTSLAPGSKVVTEYLAKAGLTQYLEKLGFYLVGYGCTTCIGNSGPLADAISKAIADGDLMVAAVLSGNRNFEGRVHPEVRANYLASPPLVVAYAIAGTMDIDLQQHPLGNDAEGKPVFLADIWPSGQEIAETVAAALDRDMFRGVYQDVFKGDERWARLEIPQGHLFSWRDESTYVKHPPYFVDMPRVPGPVAAIRNARVLAVLGDSITTDHISPAGNIRASSPAGKYLQERGIRPEDFNSYGSRRGNHEVMVRGTFANVRLRNKLAPGTEGGVTRHLPDGEGMSIFDAAMAYEKEGVPLIVLAGAEYGSGSSRDWAAKGPKLLGVRAVIAESFERIHRSNLIGMGILPLQFVAGDGVETLGLTGEEVYDIEGVHDVLAASFAQGREVTVSARRSDGVVREFHATVRIDTPQEIRYYQHGGILHYVLRQLLAR
jgi:aconitate hydratase